ncbi:MAG TPA: sugar transferase [Candidatus Acidoferrum sp.]|nr:sugar transferase [Candidatus Acidoferrum sp.]
MSATFYAKAGKRGLDVLGSSLGLLFLSPLFLIVAVLVKASSAGPVFFRQVRVGQLQRPFRIFKFRSMRAGNPGRGGMLTADGDPRITPVGRFLRKSKLDESPQLINVFLGEMSLVGPRPEVPVHTANYTAEQRQVFAHKPGITGPAAIASGGEEELLARQADKLDFYLTILLPAKLSMDLDYCSKISAAEDLRLIFLTFASIFGKPSSRNPLLGLPEKQS